MGDDDVRGGLHRAMHRLPGVPGHDRAGELNGNRAGRVRGVRMNEAGRARARRWNTEVNEAGLVRVARWHASSAARQPRVLVGVQGFIARVLGH
jgi:hypothetical protein